uniref:Neuroglian n=1 Tax=Rhabditophanes sp. KR3021 TaxID=114890 RepID=A0AC35U7T9_9BILA
MLPSVVVIGNEGQDAEFKCEIDGLQENDMTVIWNKRDSPIFVDEEKIDDDERYSVVKNGNFYILKIEQLTAYDSGEYVCVYRDKNDEQQSYSYNLDVVTKPTVSLSIEANPHWIKAKTSTSIRCHARGNPIPRVSWTRRGKKELPANVKVNDGTIYFNNVDESTSGMYQCKGENAYGVDIREVEILIPWAPVVWVDSIYIPAMGGQDVNVTCNYNGYPSPTVHWNCEGFRLGLKQDTLSHEVYAIRRNNYTSSILMIKNITDKYFGTFSCVVSNDYGAVTKNIYVSPTPGPPHLTLLGTKLSWVVSSKKKIQSFRILWRESASIDFGWPNKHNVSLENAHINGFNYSGTFDLRDILEPLKIYEVQLEALNEHGWGRNAYHSVEEDFAVKSGHLAPPMVRPNSPRPQRANTPIGFNVGDKLSDYKDKDLLTKLNIKMFKSRLVILFVFALMQIASSRPKYDEIKSMPGINFQPNFKQYSGFLQASNKHYFHYWYTEAQSNPETAPVILWLTGGPGCSSILALLEECGPFRVGNYGNTVFENPYSWNKIGNVLFLSSPAGVGYSYSTDGNITATDDQVALDNYNAVLNFFHYKFPELQGRDLWATGESYAGVYTPTLAAHLVDDTSGLFNFKGMAIGNGMYNFPNNYNTMVSLFYYRGFIRQNLYDTVNTECCNGNPYTCDYFGLLQTQGPCREMILKELNSANDLDPYNSYSTCYNDTSSGLRKKYYEKQYNRLAGLSEDIQSDVSIPLCDQTNNTEIWMNRDDVRNALHIPSTLQHWTECSDSVGEQYQITHYDMTPEFQKILKAGKRVLVYNGDVDTACNIIMNEKFVNNLNLTIADKDQQLSKTWIYYNDNPNTAGYLTQYKEGLDFVTVRGSGHLVPQDKPREAQQMLYNFINQKDYSTPVPFSTSYQQTTN